MACGSREAAYSRNSMTEYRIKKGGREFKATRVKTLEELVRRGLLGPTDRVSVDGREDTPLSELTELQSVFTAEDPVDDTGVGAVSGGLPEGDKLSPSSGSEDSSNDPWRHWSDFEADEGDSGPDTSEDDVLTSFLGQVELTESGTFPALRWSSPKVPAVSREAKTRNEASPPDEELPNPPPSEAPPDRIDPVEFREAELESIPPASAAPEPELEAEAVSEIETSSRSASSSAAGPPGGLDDRSRAPSDEAELTQEMLENPDLPVSFRDWLQKNESGAATGQRLERFGRYDDGIVRPGGRSPGRFSVFRVLLVVCFGGAIMWSYSVYIHTAATSSFPMESELAGRMPGAVGIRKPSVQLGSLDTPVGSLTQQLPAEHLARRAREKEVRQKVRSSVVDFTTAETLEDAIFQELTNGGVKPMAVLVEPVGHKGSADKYSRRPTKANLTISLSTISVTGDRGYEVLEERLIYTWLLVGKYATLGRIQFEDVKITVAPPLAWSQRYEGRRLALLWEQQLEATALFPDE